MQLNRIHISWRHVAISILIPIVAACIQSIPIILWRNYRIYQAVLWPNPFHNNYWIVLAAESFVTFLILWPFLKHPYLRWIVLVGICATWTYLAILSEAAIKSL